jgi:hypothetical protein
MAAQITVEATEDRQGWQCRVTVTEGPSHTVHSVTVARSYRDKLVGPHTPVERLVEKSFEFLLAHEPKESILRSFELSVINRYFPEYEESLRTSL